jgi:hypothetical protein
MKWIKLFEEFDESEMIIVSMLDDLGFEGLYDKKEYGSITIYSVDAPDIKVIDEDLLKDALSQADYRLKEYNPENGISFQSTLRIMYFLKYNKKTAKDTISDIVKTAYEDMVVSSEENFYDDEFSQQLETVESINVVDVEFRNNDLKNKKHRDPIITVTLDVKNTEIGDKFGSFDTDDIIYQLWWKIRYIFPAFLLILKPNK